MIQRIQSVYLFLAVIFMVLFYMYPIATFSTSTFHYQFFSCHITHPENLKPPISLFPLAVMSTMSILLSLISIFMYKNRKLQILLGNINISSILFIIITTVLYYLRIANMIDGTPLLNYAGIFPILSLILIVLANSAIRKDEKLVRSADRIR